MKSKQIFLYLTYFAGVLQIVGGTLGTYSLYLSSSNQGYKLWLSMLIVIPFILLNFVAGISIFLSKGSKTLILSIVNYFLQSFQFMVAGFYYFYSMGPFFGLGFVKKFNQSIAFWEKSSEFYTVTIIQFISDKNSYFLTVNFVAIFFVLVLIKENFNRKSSLTLENPLWRKSSRPASAPDSPELPYPNKQS